MTLKRPLHLGLIGLIQGGLFYYFYNLSIFSPTVHYAILAFIVLFGLFIQLALPAFSLTKLMITSLLLSLTFAAVFGWRYGADTHLLSHYLLGFLLFVLSIYIVNTFHQVYHQSGAFVFPYTQLFRHSWNTVFIILLGFVFFILCKLLLLICEYLFAIVGITFFSDVFESRLFSYVIHPFLFGFGLGLAKEYENIITSLRNILLGLFFILLPILAVIGITFIVTLFFKTIIVYFSRKMIIGEHVSHYALYTWVSLFIIIFINAVFQDGQTKPKYPVWLQNIITALIVISPAFSILAVYDLWTEIATRGTDIYMIQLLIITFILTLYLVSYAVNCFRSNTWLGFLPKNNIMLALVVVAIAILINSPIVDTVAFIKHKQLSLIKQGKNPGGYVVILTYSDLRGLSLSGVNLAGADLRYADLSNADLSRATLTNANLSYAKLSQTNLKNANLFGALFSYADLHEANFTDANINYASFINSAGLTQNQINSAQCIKDHDYISLPKQFKVNKCK